LALSLALRLFDRICTLDLVDRFISAPLSLSLSTDGTMIDSGGPIDEGHGPRPASSTWQHIRDDAARTIVLVGQVVECGRPRHLVLTWADPADAGHKSKHTRVSFDLERSRTWCG